MAKNEIEKLVDKLSKKYGTLRIAGNVEDTKEYISTGNLALDLALEGGVALGYAMEWSGKSGSGKTALLQIMLADMQKKYDTYGIWLDREKAFFNKRAEEIGIDLKKTIVIDPSDIPTAVEAEIIMKEVLMSLPKDAYKFIAIDSISAFSRGGKAEKSDMGKKAQSLHGLFREILAHMDRRTSFHFTNQRTFKVGVMFGDPETTTGGEAPKYYTTYRIKLDDKKAIKDAKRGNEIVGNWVKATIIKTRTGPNFRNVTFPFYFRGGIPYYGGYARLLANRGYLSPNNKTEFNSFKQSTLSYLEEKKINEFEIEKFLEKYPELLFAQYPEYNINADIIEEENDEFVLGEED